MYADIIRQLRQRGVEFGIGLSDEEFCWITDEYGIVFSQELMSFYKEALPVSEGFYNWRDKREENVEKIKEVMESPIRWIVKNSKEIDWNEKWGKEPENPDEREHFIADMAVNAPKLIPIYAHRYMVSVKCERPPVLSIHGADVIYFAKNIIDYFLIEFGIRKYCVFMNDEVSCIPFWSDLL